MSLGGFPLGSIAAGVGDLKWLGTYATSVTASGPLTDAEYVADGQNYKGTDHWIITIPAAAKSTAPIIGDMKHTTNSADTASKTVTSFTGTAYYSEFLRDDGTIVREATTQEVLDNLRTVPGYPIPVKAVE